MTGRTSALSPALAGVLALWALAVWLIGWRGEFPLSDDWAYAHAVRSLCEGRGFDLLPWTGASLVVQALYGAAACKLTGFSHEMLRATTLAVSLVGIVSFHGLLRVLGAGERAAAFGAAVLAFCPLWLNLSFTFMTDVPFAALAMLASWLFVRALADRSRSGLLLAGAAAAASLLVRQHGVWIAVAAAAAALCPAIPRRASGSAAGSHDAAMSAVSGESSLSGRVLDAAAALAIPLLAGAAYAWWTATGAEVPLAVRNKLGEALASTPLEMAGAAFRALATLGFLFLPWALTMRFDAPSQRRAFAATLTVLGAAAAFLYAREGDSMFYLTNVLGDASVGAVTTRDVLFLAQPAGTAGGTIFHFALTAVSLASAAALLATLATGFAALLSPVTAGFASTWAPTSGGNGGAHRGRDANVRPALFCLFALALSALGTLAQAHYYFDRYVLVLLPLAIACTVAVSPRVELSALPAVALAVLAAYSVAGTHDYLEWNRARWNLLGALEAAGVTARQIDGGFEYNASRLAAELRTAPSDAQARSGQPASTRSWWWVVDDEWIVAFGELDGYAAVDSRSFSRWLPPGEGRVLTLRREAPAGGGPQAGDAPRSASEGSR